MMQITKSISFLLLFFLSFYGKSQEIENLEVLPSTFFINSIPILGYQTDINFDRKKIRKAWWKYSKKIGYPLDMKTHYRTTIPTSSFQKSQLVLYAQTEKTPPPISFKLGVRDTAYLNQIKEVIIEFKKTIYLDHYSKKYDVIEDHSKNLSKGYLKTQERSKKEKLLDTIFVNDKRLEMIKAEIKKIMKW